MKHEQPLSCLEKGELTWKVDGRWQCQFPSCLHATEALLKHFDKGSKRGSKRSHALLSLLKASLRLLVSELSPLPKPSALLAKQHGSTA